MIYILVALLLIFLALRFDIGGKTKDREFWYRLVLFLFVAIAGFRYRLGTDTPVYIYEFYHKVSTLDKLSIDDLDVGNYPLWYLLNSLVLTFFGKFFIVQIIQSAILNILIFKYIKKHSRYIFTCVFFYFIYMYFDQNMEEMKSAISLAVALYGNDYILEKKWIKAYLLYFVALLFHPSAAFFLLTPLFLFLRLNFTGVLLLFLSLFAGLLIQEVLDDYMVLLEFSDSIYGKVSSYAESDVYSEQNSNLNFYIINIFPFIVYSILSLLYVRRNNNNGMLKLEPFLMLGLIFLFMQMNAQIFYRYVHFYSLYFVLFFSEFFAGMIHKRRMLQIDIAIVRSAVIFAPLLFAILFVPISRYPKYYPYSSVIERKVDAKREHKINEARPKPRAVDEEY